MICLDVNYCSYELSDKKLQALKNDSLDDAACHRNKLCIHWLFSLVTVPAGHSSSRDARCYQAPVEHCRPSTEENVRDRFTCSNLVISKILARYILTPQQSSLMGYPMPVLSLGPNAGTVNYVPYPTGHNPADTSGPILDNCYATYNPVTNTYFSTSFKRIKCVRCFKIFFLTLSNKYMFKEEECVYHWGKYIEKIGQPDKKFWSCCGGEATNPGCERAKMHVWNGVMPGSNPLFNCMLTKKPETQPRDGFYGVYGLDTEMCYTRNGLEIVQIALVDMNGTVVYDTYVKPEAEVIDYNTRFSGVTASDLDGVEKTLKDVHKELASFIHADTILIGHGMENDLRALRLLHKHCIDTSVVFPHHYGLPYRNGLKYLAKRLLNRDIHVRSHDPAEDARTAVDLILLKLHSDYCEK